MAKKVAIVLAVLVVGLVVFAFANNEDDDKTCFQGTTDLVVDGPPIDEVAEVPC
jgi:hypothetical protein